jgi:hypothetical protein
MYNTYVVQSAAQRGHLGGLFEKSPVVSICQAQI